jgi:hypothetical protein
VTQVRREQHRGERLDADRVSERPTVERAQLRDAGDEPHHHFARVVVVAADHDVTLQRLVERGERGGGHVLERGNHLRAGGDVVDGAGEGLALREHRAELAAHLLQAVGHRDHRLPGERVRVGRRGVDRALPGGGNHGKVTGLGRVLVGTRVERVDARTPLVAELGHHRFGPALLPGAGDDVVPDAGQPRREATPRRAGRAEHSDVHRCSLA